MVERDIKSLIKRVADGLDRLSPPAKPTTILDNVNAFVWNADRLELIPVSEVNRLELSLLIGIEQARDILLKNTRQFAAGYPANNALLWGARGMGKSSLVKAVHGKISSEHKVPPVLIELQREEQFFQRFPTFIPSSPKMLFVMLFQMETLKTNPLFFALLELQRE